MKRLWVLGLFFVYPLCASQIDSPEVLSQMIEKAMEGQKNAYAPYSEYAVGVALLTASGKIYTGSNIENASFGLTNCAERTAVFKAVSEGDKEIEAVVLVTRNGGMPCGACRQVLNEFNPNMVIITIDETGKVHSRLPLNELLPNAFGPANLVQ